MIVLDQPTKKLEVVLAGAVTTNQLDINSYFFDQYPQTQSQPRHGHNYVASNSTTDVTAVSAPPIVGIRRNIFTMSVYNKDTAQSTVTVKIDDGGSERILVKQTLNAGDSLNYEHGAGWTFTTPVSVPFSDTLNIIKGSADPTKQIRFEVDGLTANTTRVLTVPDADLTIVGHDTTQTLTNKTVTDASFTIQDDGDNTKKAKFQASGISAGQTRTFTFPDSSGTLTLDSAANGTSVVLLQATAASGAATVDFSTGISSTYDVYILTFTQVVPQTDNTDLWVRASTDGGSSFLTTNAYTHGRSTLDSSGAPTGSGAGGTADQIVVRAAVGNDTNEQISGHLWFFNLSSTTKYKSMTGQAQGLDSSALFGGTTGYGQINTASAVNALRVMMSSGNITGNFALYGVKKA